MKTAFIKATETIKIKPQQKSNQPADQLYNHYTVSDNKTANQHKKQPISQRYLIEIYYKKKKRSAMLSWDYMVKDYTYCYIGIIPQLKIHDIWSYRRVQP